MAKEENRVKGLILLGLVVIWEHIDVAVWELSGEGMIRLQKRSLLGRHIPGHSGVKDLSRDWKLKEFLSNRFDLDHGVQHDGSLFTRACLAYTLLIFLQFCILPYLSREKNPRMAFYCDTDMLNSIYSCNNLRPQI